MKVLVLGSGGREHALAWKLAQEAVVICAPGNAGMESDVETRPVDLKDHVAVVELAQHLGPDMVVIGPDDQVVAGLGDDLRSAGFVVFGPGADWGRLEGSKAFSKALMGEAGIPTARFDTFTEVSAAREGARKAYAEGRQLAVKASGVALGKGVTVAETLDEALEAIERMMVHREFGASGDTVVLEERLVGREFSLLTLIGDHNFVSLPVAQDHKRAFDGDLGPNTGGMGAYSPCGVSADLVSEVEASMVEPIFRAIKERGGLYRGTLFTGIMMTAEGPKCLEYNVRFGDPETQTLMVRLGSGFARALYETATGAEIRPLEVLDNEAVTVFVASGGYPGSYAKGLPITLPESPSANTKLFWAGIGRQDGGLVTAGGRVVAATAWGDSFDRARELAYETARCVRFDGAFFRSDIGASPVLA